MEQRNEVIRGHRSPQCGEGAELKSSDGGFSFAHQRTGFARRQSTKETVDEHVSLLWGEGFERRFEGRSVSNRIDHVPIALMDGGADGIEWRVLPLGPLKIDDRVPRQAKDPGGK